MQRRTPWFAILQPMPSERALLLKILAFVLPLVAWCVVSYVPFVWHPMMKITDPGGAVDSRGRALYKLGDLLESPDFNKRNSELSSAGKTPLVGVRANPIFLPAPHQVAQAMYTAFTTRLSPRDPWLHQSIGQSIYIIFCGFVLSAIVGVPLGILCGTFDLFSKLVEPFVDFIRYMPAPAFGALAIAIMSINDAPKIAIIFVGTFFQMVLVVANTTRNVDSALLEAAQTLGATRPRLLTRVIVPGMLPNLFNDMRILLGWAWTYLIVAELVGAASGISYFINQQGKYRNYANVYAGIIIIGVLGLVTDQVLALVGRFIFPWKARAQATDAGIFPLFRMILGWGPKKNSLAARQSGEKIPSSDAAEAGRTDVTHA